SAGGKPQEIMVGFYLVNGGKLDFQNSSVPLDFYLWMNYTGSEPPRIEFTNSRNAVLSAENIDMGGVASSAKQCTLSYRVTGTFEQDMDMKKYPFDHYVIRICLEETEKNVKERIFYPDTAGTNLDERFQIIGWNIDKREIDSEFHRYHTNFGIIGNEEDTYSRLEFRMHISRNHRIIFIKIVTPILLFLAIALLGLIFPIEQLNQKISLSVAALFSSVAYHINLSTGIPPVGYLTFIDKMMIAQYGILFVNVLFTVSIFAASRAEWKTAETRILRASRILIPLLAVLVYAALFSSVNL
ncbi:MAG TPA: hypothetical protein PKM25_12355, partial [Candidatus Ozemobacteraceae bacterium]|nr:hypothetical protein [Candidatus Ozemobacteraceae bacterium]